MKNLKQIAVFASGTGTNFEAIAKACEDGRIAAQVALMVCDKPGAEVEHRARRHGIPAFVFSPRSYASKADFEREIVTRLDAAGVSLVCLAGYMRLIGPTLLDAYRGRIINIHPSLLPAFKGAHAVEDAVAYGVKVFGITIHYVDETLDGGPIIAQRAFPYEGSDPAEVHRLGQIIEHQLYIETIQKIIDESISKCQ
ncbi:MAG: phosphoribosylglycinamide formyltransferase [Bacteroidales bacterium]|nr:phosphoribosylglycinamide formyltransferase [Bacteroidales bacterium]